MQHRHLTKQTWLSRVAKTGSVVKASIAILLIVAGLILGVSSSAAQASWEVILSYDIEIELRDDNSMHVIERIEYDFTVPRHGIFRDIITTGFWLDDSDLERVWAISNFSVFSSTAPDQVSKSNPAKFYSQYRIGDPDIEITGTHVYTIEYDQAGIVDSHEATDEFFWNVVGMGWNVPIEDVSITIHLPSDALEVTCFYGDFRSTTQCDRSNASGVTAQFTQARLEAFEGITVAIAMEKGSVPNAGPILREIPTFSSRMALDQPHLIATAAILALAIGLISSMFWRVGRDRRSMGGFTEAAYGSGDLAERVPMGELKRHPVQFAPPDKLVPAQFYLILKERVPDHIISATIVHLAVKGHLTIEDIGKGDDYKLTRLDKEGDLLAFEDALLARLFSSTDDVLISSLQYEFAEDSKAIQEAIYADGQTNKWFIRRPDDARTIWAVSGFMLFLAGVGVTALAAFHLSQGILFTPIAVAGIFIVLGARWMPAKTPRGSGLFGRARGFAYFLEQSEAYRSEFAEKAHLFTEYLPYVMAIGATEKWIDAFEGIHMEAPSWYISPYPFVPYGFGHSMNSFVATTASTITSIEPSSSSGSSGFSGGFSGGGGGGGGGGSW